MDCMLQGAEEQQSELTVATPKAYLVDHKAKRHAQRSTRCLLSRGSTRLDPPSLADTDIFLLSACLKGTWLSSPRHRTTAIAAAKGSIATATFVAKFQQEVMISYVMYHTCDIIYFCTFLYRKYSLIFYVSANLCTCQRHLRLNEGGHFMGLRHEGHSGDRSFLVSTP